MKNQSSSCCLRTNFQKWLLWLVRFCHGRLLSFCSFTVFNPARPFQPLVMAVCADWSERWSNGNQPHSPDNRDTLLRVNDMSEGDKDSGSFYHLAEGLAGQFTLGPVLHGRVRAAGQKGSCSQRLPLVSLSPRHVNWALWKLSVEDCMFVVY